MTDLNVYISRKLGPEADAVLRLIQGDIPENNKERENMIEGIAYRLSVIHKSHGLARKIVDDYKRRHHQFGLYLRNFGLEARGPVIDVYSHKFESWVRTLAASYNVSLMSLRGGSDELFGAKPVFSTVSSNWLAVAEDLIAAAKFIVIFAGDRSAGLTEEIGLIRAHAKQHRCVVAVTDKGPPVFPLLDRRLEPQHVAPPEDLTEFFAGFPHIFAFNPQRVEAGEEDAHYADWPGAEYILAFATDEFTTALGLAHASDVPCQQIDPEVKKTADYQHSTVVLRKALDMLETELNVHQMELRGMSAERMSWDRIAQEGMHGWVGGHFCYGLSVAVEDYEQMVESLRYLARFHTYVLRDPDSGGFHLIIARNIASLVGLTDQIRWVTEEHTTHAQLFWALEETAGLRKALEAVKDSKAVDPAAESLHPKLAAYWQMLTVFPDDFDLEAAAAVGGVSLDAARTDLSTLLAGGKLSVSEPSGRYRIPERLRDAGGRAKGEEDGTKQVRMQQRLAEAETRHAAHYVKVLAAAEELYTSGGEGVKKALELFDLERRNIESGQTWAMSHAAKNTIAATLSSEYGRAGTNVISLRKQPHERVIWLDAALSAARTLEEHSAEGARLMNLGSAYADWGRYDRAIEHHRLALELARRFEDRMSIGKILAALGMDFRKSGDLRQALDHYKEALLLAEQIGDRRTEARVLNSLGLAYKDLGEFGHALEYYRRALEANLEIGDRISEAQVLGNMGVAFLDIGDSDRAVEHHQRNVEVAREIGDHRGEGIALGNLANGVSA